MTYAATPAISVLTAAFWSAMTIAFYLLTKAVHRRYRYWWLSPPLTAPLLLIMIAIALHANYSAYVSGTHWLLLLLGPATVALAVPIYQQRTLIRRHWPELALGMVAGSAAALFCSWWLTRLFGLDDALQHSAASPTTHGSVVSVTAAFVMLTGLMGAALGEALLTWLPLRSALARGTLLGLGTHHLLKPRTRSHDAEETRLAGLLMVMIGLFNMVAAAPFVAHMLR